MKKGFSLAEAIVLVAVSTVVLLALVNLFFIFNSIYGYQKAFIATAGSAGASANALQSAVLQASGVLASRSFSGVTYTSASSSLVLKLPSVDGDGDIVLGKDDYLAFYISSSTLYRLVEADGSSARISGRTILSTTISSLEFTYDAATFSDVRSIEAQIETEMVHKGELVGSSLTEKWYLRNAPL